MLRQAFFYGLALLMMKGMSLVMLPFITQYMPIADYGRLEVLIALANVATLVLGFGLIDVLYRFSAGLDEVQRKCMAAELFGLSLVVGLLALLLLQWSAAWVANILPGNVSVIDVRWLMVAIALEGAIAMPLAWLRMRERVVLFFVLSTVKALVQALLTLWCLHHGWGVEGVVFAGAVAAVILVLGLVGVHGRDVGIKFSLVHAKPMMSYGVPIVISGLAAFGLAGFDRWLLVSELGEAAVAPFAVAMKFTFVIILLMQPFTLWWYPRRFRVLNEAAGLAINARYAVLGAALAVLVSGVVAVFAPWLIIWLTPSEYHQAINYVPWLCWAMALKLLAELLNVGCYNGEDSRIQMKIHLVSAALGVVGYCIFIPVYGVAGAIGCLLFAYAVRLIMFYVMSQQLLRLPYQLAPLYGAVCVVSALVVLGQLAR